MRRSAHAPTSTPAPIPGRWNEEEFNHGHATRRARAATSGCCRAAGGRRRRWTGTTSRCAPRSRRRQMQAATNDVLQGRLDHWASVAVPVHDEAASQAPVSEAGTPITDYGYAGTLGLPDVRAVPVPGHLGAPRATEQDHPCQRVDAAQRPGVDQPRLPPRESARHADRRRPHVPRQVRVVQLLGRDQRSRSGHPGRVPRPGAAVQLVQLLVPLPGPGSGSGPVRGRLHHRPAEQRHRHGCVR